MYQSTQSWLERLWSTLGLVLMVFAFPFLAYAGLLWIDGVERPMDAAIHSPMGTVWMYVLFGTYGLAALVAASFGVQWLVVHRTDLPGHAATGARWVGSVAAAPLLYPVRAWRDRTAAGAGIFTRIASSTYAVLIGLVVWLMAAFAVFVIYDTVGRMLWSKA